MPAHIEILLKAEPGSEARTSDPTAFTPLSGHPLFLTENEGWQSQGTQEEMLFLALTSACTDVV